MNTPLTAAAVEAPEGAAETATATQADALELRPIRDLDDLASVLAGTLSRPADADWNDARRAWQLLVEQHPIAVVTAANRHDLVLTVRAAAALGLRVAAQSTGHNAAPLGDLSRTILLRTSALNHVTVDPHAHVARVEAGALWGDVTAAVAEAGLTAIGGFDAGVGVIGLLLGGGLGWFARSHGPASASALAFDVVTADGVPRRVDAGHHPDLFAAILRGADVGIIAAVELRLHEIADVVAGALFWPVASAREVFHAWAEWTAEAPDAVTSTVRVLRFPDAPGVPPMFAGRAFAIIEAVVQGTPAEADALLEPLRALAPHIDTVGLMPPSALAALHMDPPEPVPALSTSALLSSLPVMTIDAIVDVLTEGDARVLTSVELRHLGGALDRGIPASFTGARSLLFAVAVAPPSAAIAPNPAAIAVAAAGFDALHTAVGPVRSPRELATFTETATDADRLYGPDLPSLRAVKRHWDPTDLIHANHSVLAGS